METLRTTEPAETPAIGVPCTAASNARSHVHAELPTGYADAEQLAAEMLAAAERGDWQGVTKLRRRIPSLARALHRQWLDEFAAAPNPAEGYRRLVRRVHQNSYAMHARFAEKGDSPTLRLVARNAAETERRHWGEL